MLNKTKQYNEREKKHYSNTIWKLFFEYMCVQNTIKSNTSNRECHSENVICKQYNSEEGRNRIKESFWDWLCNIHWFIELL